MEKTNHSCLQNLCDDQSDNSYKYVLIYIGLGLSPSSKGAGF